MTAFEPRARWTRRAVAWPVCAGLLLVGWPARAAEQTIELSSRGGYQSHRLPDGTTDVELAQQTGGGCRFGRTWGFDPAAAAASASRPQLRRPARRPAVTPTAVPTSPTSARRWPRRR